MDTTEQLADLEKDGTKINKQDGLKQRLIGAIVLVSLAVIFLPMIFDEPHQDKKNIVIPIPDKPTEKIVTFEVPKAPAMQGGDGASKSLEIIHESEKQNLAKSKATVVAVDEVIVPSTSNDNEARDENQSATKNKKEPLKPKSLVTVKPKPIQVDTVKNTKKVTGVSHSSGETKLPANLDQSWVVQLGTFGNKVNANKLRDKARSQGYSTHTVDIQRSGKSLTRVFAGPFIKKEEALKVKGLLDKTFKVSSIVVKFSE